MHMTFTSSGWNGVEYIEAVVAIRIISSLFFSLSLSLSPLLSLSLSHTRTRTYTQRLIIRVASV